MKFYKLIILGIVLALISSCGQPQVTQNKAAVKQIKAKQYTCTMHPEVIKDKPGVCPKCGMDLVEKEK